MCKLLHKILDFFRPKKVVILSGVGAVFPWGATSTKGITDKIRQDQDFTTMTGMPIGEYLFSLLSTIYIDEENINFETIIDLLEVLYDYYYGQHRGRRTHFKSNLTAIFKVIEDVEKNILDFDSIYKKEERPGITWYFSRIKRIPFLPTPSHLYLRRVYEHFINIIVEEVEKYVQKSNLDSRADLNKNFSLFLKFFKRCKLRLYTTNYDQIPSELAGLELYNGFDKVPRSTAYSMNIRKIMSDTYRYSLFNLHGCVNYRYSPIHANDGELLGLGWEFTPGRINKLDPGTTEVRDQTQRALMHSHIVTGLYKASRIIIEPQYSFYQKFCLDCLSADLIITIGYSYNDFHINQAIKNGHKIRNPKIRDINYFKDWFEHGPFRGDGDWRGHESKLVSIYEKEFENGSSFRANGDWVKPKFGDLRIYWKGFDKFLLEKKWLNIWRTSLKKA